MKKGWIVIAIIVILLAVGAYFLFWNSPASSSSQYQASTISGTSGNSTSSVASKYSGIDLTPTSPQTDVVPSSGSTIPAP